MQYHELKKQLVQRVTSATLLCVLGAGGYFLVGAYQEGLIQKQQSTQREIVALNNRISAFERKQQEYEEARKLWDRLSDRQKKREGLEIAAAQQLMEQLKNYYLLRSLKVNLSKPVELKDIYKTTTTVVLASKVDLVFEGLSDEQIFSFIGALEKYMPGYITVRSFRLSRGLGVTEGTLEKIRTGVSLPMVKGDISFNWRDLKDISQAPPAPPPPEGGQ